MSTDAAEPESPLGSLKTRLQRFPERRDAVKRVEALKQLALLVSGLAVENARIRVQCENVLLAFPDVSADEVERLLLSVNSKATIALRQVNAPSTETALDQAMTDLRRATQAAGSQVASLWRVRIDAVVAQFERLTKALQAAGVTGSNDLAATVARVREASTPPEISGAGRSVREDVMSFGPSLAAIGLSDGFRGSVGQFLIAAAEGRGNAMAVLDPEVRTFLDANDLWSTLIVRLR